MSLEFCSGDSFLFLGHRGGMGCTHSRALELNTFYCLIAVENQESPLLTSYSFLCLFSLQ